MSDVDHLREWEALPRRIYLDTSTLQSVYDFSDAVFELEPFLPVGRAGRVAGLAEEIDALQTIFRINERAMFEFAVSNASLNEVAARESRGFTRWVADVLDTWLIQTAGEQPSSSGVQLQHPRFGMISSKDRLLLQDALDWSCDAFLTMERKLPTAAAFLERETGLRVMRPSNFRTLLEPWQALFS